MKLSHIRKFMEFREKFLRIAEPAKQEEFLRELGIDLGEIYQELEMESRYVDTHRDISHGNSNVNLHSHDFFEILYCRSCAGVEYLVGTERYRLEKGDIILVRPGVSHRPLLPEHMEGPYERDVLWLSVEFLQTLQAEQKITEHSAKCLLRTANTRWEYLGERFAAGVQEAENEGPTRELAVIGNTITLIAHLLRAFSDPMALPLRAENPELMDRVLAYMEENLTRKLTLEETARHFYVSESTISQTFRKKMGVSFYRYVTQRRLISAKSLIQQGTALEDVAERTGFSDYSTFYRAFKKEYGISPRQYKNLA